MAHRFPWWFGQSALVVKRLLRALAGRDSVRVSDQFDRVERCSSTSRMALAKITIGIAAKNSRTPSLAADEWLPVNAFEYCVALLIMASDTLSGCLAASPRPVGALPTPAMMVPRIENARLLHCTKTVYGPILPKYNSIFKSLRSGLVILHKLERAAQQRISERRAI